MMHIREERWIHGEEKGTLVSRREKQILRREEKRSKTDQNASRGSKARRNDYRTDEMVAWQSHHGRRARVAPRFFLPIILFSSIDSREEIETRGVTTPTTSD